VGAIEAALTLGAAGLFGCFIGSVGIGGVLLVPWLTVVTGLDVREAVSVAMASYVATGIAAILQARLADDWARLWSYWPLVAATLPGAFLGGMAIGLVPQTVALGILALFLILTGAWSLARERLSVVPAPATPPPGWPTGLFSGFASAMTGTGGPAVLMPILLWRHIPLLAAIALGQIVQLPIALAATSGNLLSGTFRFWIAVLVAAGLTPGVVIGRWVARRLAVDLLARIVAVLLVLTGLFIGVRTIF
jgi:uncharacterized membrane protein YfcA